MGNRVSLYQLNGEIEFDEGYFEQAISEQIKLKRSRCSQRQSNVAIIAESTPLEDIVTGKTSSQYRFFKMKVLASHNKEEVNKQIIEYINEKTIIYSYIKYQLRRFIRISRNSYIF